MLFCVYFVLRGSFGYICGIGNEWCNGYKNGKTMNVKKMVKNSGGNRAKGLARKNILKPMSTVRVAEDGEEYAQAIRVLGGRIVSVKDINGNVMQGHIRGKFSGRGKRGNFIEPNTWLLVGKRLNFDYNKDICDVLEVYSEEDKHWLKTNELTVDWSVFIAEDMKTVGGKDEENDICFADDAEVELDELLKYKQIDQTVDAYDDIIDVDAI